MASTRSAARSPDRIDPSMVAGKPVSVQSPARNRFFASGYRARPQRVLLRRRCESRAALAHDLPRRQIGTSTDPRPCRYRRQIACASSSRGMSTSRSPLLMVTERRCGNANSHSISAADDAESMAGSPRGGSKRKCALTMARNLVGVCQARQQRCGGARRHRQHHGVVRAEAQSLSSPKFSSLTRVRRRSRIRAAHGRNGCRPPLSCSSSIAGSTSTALRPSRAISGRQACAARQQRFAHDRAGEPGRALRRIDVQRRQQQRLHQPIDRACPRRGWRRRPAVLVGDQISGASSR